LLLFVVYYYAPVFDTEEWNWRQLIFHLLINQTVKQTTNQSKTH